MKEGPMDPLLRKALGAADAPVTPACVDAERLAAWSAGTLAADDAAAVESHLSTCGRCQAMAAVFSQIEPAVPATVPFWRRRFVGWLIPLTAVATAVALWIARPRVPDLPLPTQVAQVQPQNTPAPLPPPPVGATSNARATPAPPVAVPAPTPPPPASQPPQPKLFVAPPTAASAAPPPPAYAPPPVQGATATADITRPAGAVFRSTGAANEASGGIIEIVAPSLATAQAAVPAGAGAAAGGAGRGGAGGGGSRGAAGGGQAAPVRWRILPTNAVERSTTGGASWQPIVIDPPANLTGGVAASSTVCWLIGRGGVVLRSVDGIHFDRVTFPETVDLASIRSTGAAQASVTTADGRVFVTIDGGLTWRLQGFQTASF
jgi:hypothetical protein